MKEMFLALFKNQFGASQARLRNLLLLYLIVFWGLHTAGFSIRVTPYLFYLMTGTFTAGVMWQTLSSKNQAARMQNMFMLPFENRIFTLSYVAALGSCTFLTKTAALLTVILAISTWNGKELFGNLLCAADAILMTSAIFSRRFHWWFGALWSASVLGILLLLWNHPCFLPILGGNGLFAFLLLQTSDGYAFCLQGKNRKKIPKAYRQYSVWRYLWRYLASNKHYLTNTAILWGAACVLPLFFHGISQAVAVPMGFAILTLNTPICILLSCDPATEQAVCSLPEQKRRFYLSYCLFLFLCNGIPDTLFLISWQVQLGGIHIQIILSALFFALQSAVFSVFLEWRYPIRGWRTECDLWHHPRKYVVPSVMLILAGILGMIPWSILILLPLSLVELAVLLL